MYTQKIANIFDHIQDHSRFRPRQQILGKQITPNFFAFDRFTLYKFLPTNLGVFKPTFYNFHGICGETVLFITQTSDRMRYFTFFQDKYARSQSGRSIVGFKRNRSKISKITHTASWFSFL